MASNCPKISEFNPVHKRRHSKNKLLTKRCPYCSLTIMTDRHVLIRDHCDGDHRLETWDKWVKIRNDETKHLGKAVHRPPGDLAMNLLEKVRSDKERKTTLEHAQIDKKVKIRGGTLWEQPLRLTQVCKCSCRPVYEVKRTAAELGKPRIMEHIGVPEMIQSIEKGLCGPPARISCKSLDRDYKMYRRLRETELEEKIKKIDPFVPFIDGLMVKGNRPKTPPPKLPILPVISFALDPDPPLYSLCNVYALKINNTLFYKEQEDQNLKDLSRLRNIPGHENCTTWTYYFNVPTKRAGRSSVYLENLGTVAIRYCWKKVRKPVPFVPEDVREQVFFFNKNEDVLSPGQCRDVKLTFFSNKVGIYNEFWELSVSNFNFFTSPTEQFVIDLYADVTEDVDNIKKKVKELKHNIVQRAKFCMAQAVVDDAIIRTMVTEPEMYAFKKIIIEADLFVMKNPVCFYHQTEVQRMKEMYTEMLPGEEWDLSIGSWRRAMMDKEFDERMMYYDSLKNSHRDLLRPWYEGDELIKQKHRAVKQLLSQLAHKFDTEMESIIEKVKPKVILDVTGPKSAVDMLYDMDPVLLDTVKAIFYLSMKDHLATTIEVCAGVLTSIDRNRWINFDFCRFY